MNKKLIVALMGFCLLLTSCKDFGECMWLTKQKHPDIKFLNTVVGGGADYPAVGQTNVTLAYAMKVTGSSGVEKCEIGTVFVNRLGGMVESSVGPLDPIFRLNPDICDYIADVDGSTEAAFMERMKKLQEAADKEAE